MKKWYAAYTKPRWEKKVNTKLTQQDYEAYLPLVKRKKQYSDRKKDVMEVILPSYIFVKTELTNLPKIRYIDGIVNFVYWNSKVAEITEAEIETLKKYTLSADELLIENLVLREGVEFVFDDKIYRNQKAVVKKVLKNKIEIFLLNLKIKMTINKKAINNE